MTPTLSTLRHQWQQLKDLHEAGALGADAYQQGRERLERLMVERILAGDAAGDQVTHPTNLPPSHVAPEAMPGASNKVGTSRSAGGTKASAGWRLPAALGAALTIAVAGYAWFGAPDAGAKLLAATSRPGDRAAQPNEDAAKAHTTDAAQMDGLVANLKQRLAGESDNAEGWGMLGRTYSVMGKHQEAVAAYERAVKLTPDDAALLADYADALAVTLGRRLEGEPAKLIARALKADPDQPKALSLFGTLAFDRGDFAGAARAWERVVTKHADLPFVAQLKDSLAEARQRAGLPAQPSDLPPGMAAVEPTGKGSARGTLTPAASNPLSVSGRVSLSLGLSAKTKPEDTVFVFARAAEGPRMPLAILKRQVKDLPFDFVLDDSTAMSPEMRLSKFKRVIVGARVSAGGDAAPKPGDFMGQSNPVALGVKDLAVEINQVVPQ